MLFYLAEKKSKKTVTYHLTFMPWFKYGVHLGKGKGANFSSLEEQETRDNFSSYSSFVRCIFLLHRR